MIEEMKTNITALSDDELTAASGGGIPWYTPSQYSVISVGLQSVILQILEATQPSYNYNDVGANFMSLMMDWGEYHLGLNGKSESDPKAVAIEMVLSAKGVDMNEVRAVFDSAMNEEGDIL